MVRAKFRLGKQTVTSLDLTTADDAPLAPNPLISLGREFEVELVSSEDGNSMTPDEMISEFSRCAYLGQEVAALKRKALDDLAQADLAQVFRHKRLTDCIPSGAGESVCLCRIFGEESDG